MFLPMGIFFVTITVGKKIHISDEQFNLQWSKCVRNLQKYKSVAKVNLSGSTYNT